MPDEVRFEIQLMPESEGGVYSNFLSVWHTAHEFTLDFAAIQPPRISDEQTIIPCRVVARVKIPPTLAFDIIKTLNDNMTHYEGVFGEIKRPEPRQPQPPESTDSGGDGAP